MKNKKGNIKDYKSEKPIYAKIPSSLHKKIRIYCASHEMDIKDFIKMVSEQFLDREETNKLKLVF